MILRTYPYCGTLVVVTLLVYTVKMVQQLTRLLVWRFDLRQSNQYSRSPVNNNINLKKKLLHCSMALLRKQLVFLVDVCKNIGKIGDFLINMTV